MVPALSQRCSACESTGGSSFCHRQTGLPSAPSSGPVGLPSRANLAQVNASYFAGSSTSASVAGTRTFGVGLPNSSHLTPPSSKTFGWPRGRRQVSASGSCLTDSKTAFSSLKTAMPCSYSPPSPLRRE
jgi:hypothetical protein